MFRRAVSFSVYGQRFSTGSVGIRTFPRVSAYTPRQLAGQPARAMMRIMSNLGPDDSGATEPIDPEQPQPVTHGQIHVSDAHGDPSSLAAQMRAHLAEHEVHLATTAGYHRPSVNAGGDTGQSSQGGFAQGGASGADYQTTNVGSECGDADSGGA